MAHVRRELEVSERRACKVIGQPRSTQRYTTHKMDKDRRVLGEIVTLSEKNPRYMGIAGCGLC